MSGPPLREAVEAALGEPLKEFVGRRRRAQQSWQTIAAALSDATDGQYQLNRETLRLWFRKGEGMAESEADNGVPPEYLSVGEAVVATGYAAGTIRALFDRGEIAGMRDPLGRRYIDPTTVADLASSITIGEAARLSGVSVQTMRRRFDDGSLAGFRTSTGNRRVYRSAVAALILDEELAAP